MGVEIADAIQATAFVAAAARAAETHRAHPRVRDDYAQLFIDAQSESVSVRRRILAAGTDEVVHRTILLDQLLMKQLPERTAKTFVNLGAGFCSRPYRLDMSSFTSVIEVDAEPVLRLKNDVLSEHEPSCPVTRVPGDVRDIDAVMRQVSEHVSASQSLIVMSEGLLVYLPPSDITVLARGMASRANVHVWLADVVSVDSAMAMSMVSDKAGARVSPYGLESLALLEDVGWTVADYRPLPVPMRPGQPRAAAASSTILDGVLALSKSKSS